MARVQAGDKELLKRIRERYRIMVDADRENRNAALEDMRFLHEPGMQWDELVKKERGTRPCYEFNKTKIKVKRIVNEMRANRPAGKVRAVEDTDKETADVYEGLCRNIANVSDADTVFDYAGEYQVGGGMGAWRVTTEYARDDAFEQDICIRPIKNPFCLYADPAASDPLKRDAEDWILTDMISKSAFEAKYGKKARQVSFEVDEFDDNAEWVDETQVRICEYWYKETYEKRLVLVRAPDGTARTLDATDPEVAKTLRPEDIIRERTAMCDKIMMCIASGDAILEGPTEQAGRNHRFVMIYGEWVVVKGKVVWCGLTRNAKDAQRSYNVSRTAVTEKIATAPNSHFWATHEQAKGNTEKWAEAHKQNMPFMLYNGDPKAPGPPIRMAETDVPIALIQEMQIADQELKDVTGVYDAALGERSNEKSGVAISRREQQTQLVNFNYSDNMSKGVKRTWEIIVDLIPEIYDTERMIRVLGADGAEDYVKVNTIDPATGQLMNDLTRGKYDVTVTVGPSFATQRQEASETYSQLVQSFPQVMAVAGDLIFKSMDLPYSDDLAERMQTLLPPPVQDLIKKGKNVPPEVAMAMAQVNQAMQMVQQQGQLVQQAAAEAEKVQTQAKSQMADLDVKRAQFDADVAKSLGNIAMQEAALATQQAGFVMKQAQATVDQGEQQTSQMQTALSSDVQNAITGIQQLAAEYLEQATQTILQMPPKVVVAPAEKPRARVIRIERQNGAMVPIYEDGQTAGRVKQIVRQNGALVPQYDDGSIDSQMTQ